MLNVKDIGLIEPYDETPPRHFRFSIVTNDRRIEVPISQPKGVHIALLTLLLAALGTPLCVIVFNALRTNDNGFAVTPLLVLAIWIIAILGPATFWLFWPVGGMLRPDHLIRFDRVSGLLSIKGGFSIFRRDEIVALLSVTDLRKRKQQTEFQIISGAPGAFAKHFVANCRELDPRMAFRNVMQKIGEFSGIPHCFAMIDADGNITIDAEENTDEQSDARKSPVGCKFES